MVVEEEAALAVPIAEPPLPSADVGFVAAPAPLADGVGHAAHLDVEIKDPVAGEDQPPPDGSHEEESVVPDADSFAVFVRLLEQVALACGGSADSGAALKGLLGETRLDSAGLPTAAADALIAGGHVESTPSGIRRSESLTRTVLAWQNILRGESEDFTACGSVALDEWAADLVARVLGSPTQKAALRRELRARGLAAFGLVAQAA